MPLNVGLILVGMFLLTWVILLGRFMNLKNIQSKISEFYNLVGREYLSFCSLSLIFLGFFIVIRYLQF